MQAQLGLKNVVAAQSPLALGRFQELDADKLRGGYYTPTDVASWLCNWAIRRKTDSVLEPSCGDGSFLSQAARRLLDLGVSEKGLEGQLQGVELVRAEADRAAERLARLSGFECRSIVAPQDFFGWFDEQDGRRFDVVIGNPPFIRYQSFPEPYRTRAMSLMVGQGLVPNRLTNIWVPFVVGAVASLSPGGRLALVLPAELLQVSYASQLRSFLTDRFKRIDILACNELFFERAEQEVILLLADCALPLGQADNVCHVTMTEAKTVEAITGHAPNVVLGEAQPKSVCHENEKWLKFFLTEQEIALMRELRASAVCSLLGDHASVDVGVVTGKNEFFVLTNEQVEAFELANHTMPLVSRSSHLRGARIDGSEWEDLAAAGDRVHLLHLAPFAGAQLEKCVAKYIEYGEKQDFHRGYKCSIRPNWYVVPSVWIPDGFMFRQIYDFPRLVLNEAHATSTDTIHRLRSRGQDTESLIANSYTWLTAASAEIEGRSYGGGVLELEPTEAERLLMPVTLNGAMSLREADQLTRAGRLDTVLVANAHSVLQTNMGLSKQDTLMLADIYKKMRDRRLARKKRGRKQEAPPECRRAHCAD